MASTKQRQFGTSRRWFGSISLKFFVWPKLSYLLLNPVFFSWVMLMFFEIPSIGRKGGLVVAWRKWVVLDVGFCSHHFVNLVVNSNPQGHPCLLSFVYGLTLRNEKAAFWYDLSCRGNDFAGPWLCLGDFNAIMHQNDKWGGRPVGSSSISGLMNRFLWQIGMIDLGFSGNPFTWSNGREGRGLIMERLDRGLANGDWCQLLGGG